MKNVMIVARQGNAVALGEGTKICKSATGVFMPSLEALKEVLMAIPTEPCETVNIHIMDTIQGLVSGSAVEYVKTGKTLSGNALTNEEIESFKEVYKLYAERILNVRFSLVKYIRKDDTANLNLKKQAYDELASYEKSAGVSRGTAVTVDPDKDLREKLTELMNKALEEGDFDKYDKLNERRTQLRVPEVVTSAPTNRVQPTFETESNVVDSADDKGVEEDDNTPIQFVSAGGEQPAF